MAFLRSRAGQEKSQGGAGRILRPGRGMNENPGQLGLFGHREHLLTRHLSGHLRVMLTNVLLDIGDELVVSLAAYRLATLTVDYLRHRSPFSVSTGIVE